MLLKSYRFPALFALTCIGQAFGGSLFGSDGGIVVANRGAGSISVIDVATSAVTNVPLPVAANTPEPMYVVHSPGNGMVFVGDRANNRVVAFDTATFSTTVSVPTGSGVFHMWGKPSTGELWVNNDIDNTVTAINMNTLKVAGSFATPADLTAMGGKPHDVILDPNGPFAYQSIVGTSGANDFIVKYNTDTFAELERIAVGKDPHVSLSAAHDKLYVPVQGAGEVVVVNRSDLSPITTLAIPNAHGAVHTSDGSVFYTTNIAGGGTDAVFAIDTASDTVLSVVDTTFGGVHNLALSPDGTRLFVTHSGATSAQVSILDASDPGNLTLLGTVDAGLNPFGIATVPEPSSTFLLSLAAIVIGIRQRRQR
ncbi:MAG: beta-propeller fold lactonase family protein [Phycisphaerae bacterium]